MGLWGRLFGAALFLVAPAGADVLEVRLESGVTLSAWPMADGQEACLTWAHSVTGGKVMDCFVNDAGRLVLARSYLHDFAAGLGEVTGRGQLRPAGDGGYWIEKIDEPMSDNRLPVRIGAPRVDHRLTQGAQSVALSQIAPGAAAQIMLRDKSAK